MQPISGSRRRKSWLRAPSQVQVRRSRRLEVDGVRFGVRCACADLRRAPATPNRGNRVSAEPPRRPRPLNFDKVKRNSDARVRADGRPEVVRSQNTRQGPTVKLDRQGTEEARRAAHQAAEVAKVAKAMSAQEQKTRKEEERKRKRREADRRRRGAARKAALAEKRAAEAAAEQAAREEKSLKEDERKRVRREAARQHRDEELAAAQAADATKTREEEQLRRTRPEAVRQPEGTAAPDNRDDDPSTPPPQPEPAVDSPVLPPPPPRREHIPTGKTGDTSSPHRDGDASHAPPSSPGTPGYRIFVSGRRPTLWERVKEFFLP